MNDRPSPPAAPLLVVATHVTALDRETGGILWHYAALRGGCRKVTIHEPWTILMDGDGDLHCVELTTGRCVGIVKTGLLGANAFLFDGDRFFVTNHRTVASFDWSGRELWRREVRSNDEWGLGGLAIPGNVMQPDYSRAIG